MHLVTPRSARPFLYSPIDTSNGEREQRKVASFPSAEGNIKVVDSIKMPSEAMSCRFSNDGNFLATALSDGSVKVHVTDNRALAYSITPKTDNFQKTVLPATCLRWRPDLPDQSYGNVLLTTYASGEVRLWHITSGKCLSTISEDRQVLAACFNCDGTTFATSGSDAKILLYDEATREQTLTLESSTNVEVMDGHVMRVFAVQFHPEEKNILVSGGWDDTIQWWDTRVNTKHSIRKIVGPHVCGEGLDIEPSTLNVVTASWRKDANLQVWDFHSGKILRDIPSDFNKSMLYSAQWKSQDTILAGGSHCNMFRFVNVSTLQTTGRLVDMPGAVYSIDNSRRGQNSLVAAASSQNIYLVQSI